ncbi:MAG TPA: ABC transporter permease [Casimicrobiaceae bacterium]|nr:ABC transporter permease [Casimicrobiaceae bacterium]
MSAIKLIGPALRGTATVIAFALIIVPILIVVVAAFSPNEYFEFPPPGFSARWFVEFFRLANMRSAFALSVELALLAATLSTILGTLGALYLARRRGIVASAIQSVFLAPLVFPTIILGVALLLIYKTIGMPVFTGLLLAHCIVAMPYGFRSVLASAQSLDPSLEEAGQSLGAGPLRTLYLVTLPLIWPGVLAGWLFAFIVSFGELNTALFLTGPGMTTLPIEIFSYLQFQGSQLVIAAASSLQIALIVILVTVIERIVGIGRIIRSR